MADDGERGLMLMDIVLGDVYASSQRRQSHRTCAAHNTDPRFAALTVACDASFARGQLCATASGF